jgi:hypothetical protein
LGSLHYKCIEHTHSTSMKSILATLLALRSVLAEHCAEGAVSKSVEHAERERWTAHLANTEILGLSGVASILHCLHGLLDGASDERGSAAAALTSE